MNFMAPVAFSHILLELTERVQRRDIFHRSLEKPPAKPIPLLYPPSHGLSSNKED